MTKINERVEQLAEQRAALRKAEDSLRNAQDARLAQMSTIVQMEGNYDTANGTVTFTLSQAREIYLGIREIQESLVETGG